MHGRYNRLGLNGSTPMLREVFHSILGALHMVICRVYVMIWLYSIFRSLNWIAFPCKMWTLFLNFTPNSPNVTKGKGKVVNVTAKCATTARHFPTSFKDFYQVWWLLRLLPSNICFILQLIYMRNVPFILELSITHVHTCTLCCDA